jgi:glutamate dehydrogenase/leucine dehydrogenase
MVLHDTTRGPATGGIRLFPYQTEEEALIDGFKLAGGIGAGRLVRID